MDHFSTIMISSENCCVIFQTFYSHQRNIPCNKRGIHLSFVRTFNDSGGSREAQFSNFLNLNNIDTRLCWYYELSGVLDGNVHNELSLMKKYLVNDNLLDNLSLDENLLVEDVNRMSHNVL